MISSQKFINDSRQAQHLGRRLGDALRRFDARVLHLMAHHPDLSLALTHLARRGQLVAAHIHITRHLPREGATPNALALEAGVSKQAMSALVGQCEAWGLVTKAPALHDKRACKVQWTNEGLLWLQAFEQAVARAEAEFDEEVGPAVATVVRLGLEAYGASARFDKSRTKRPAAT
jgi:DNA-binding MarR family transcriptional regulator